MTGGGWLNGRYSVGGAGVDLFGPFRTIFNVFGGPRRARIPSGRPLEPPREAPGPSPVGGAIYFGRRRVGFPLNILNLVKAVARLYLYQKRNRKCF